MIFASLQPIKTPHWTKPTSPSHLPSSSYWLVNTKPLVVPIEDVMETEIWTHLPLMAMMPDFGRRWSCPTLSGCRNPVFWPYPYKLDLRFNYHRQWVLGTADLDLRPYFGVRDSLVLDAKGMDIHEVTDRVSLKNTTTTIQANTW